MNPVDEIVLQRLWQYALTGEVAPSPRIRLNDLSYRMKVLVGKAVIEALAERDRRGSQLSDSEVYLGILHRLGVACPHVWRDHMIENPFGGPSAFMRDGPYAAHANECVHCGMLEIINKWSS